MQYKIVEAKREDGSKFYRVYALGAHDGLSDHATRRGAEAAVKAYQAADRRRAA